VDGELLERTGAALYWNIRGCTQRALAARRHVD
jgi:hypothetical protein